MSTLLLVSVETMCVFVGVCVHRHLFAQRKFGSEYWRLLGDGIYSKHKLVRRTRKPNAQHSLLFKRELLSFQKKLILKIFSRGCSASPQSGGWLRVAPLRWGNVLQSPIQPPCLSQGHKDWTFASPDLELPPSLLQPEATLAKFLLRSHSLQSQLEKAWESARQKEGEGLCQKATPLVLGEEFK